ncbi:hypothetical protein IFM89_016762, partial [Coptis chinensis]
SMAKSCKGLAMELVNCLSESDCVKVENKSYRECASEKSAIHIIECVGLRETYFNCKRGRYVSFSHSFGDFGRWPIPILFICFSFTHIYNEETKTNDVAHV